jgi:DMSO reductase family type II enzyme chaperone
MTTVPPIGTAEETVQGCFRNQPATTARSVAYALFSQLVASPHESGHDSSAGSEHVLLPPEDLSQTLSRLEEALPFDSSLGELAAAAAEITTADGERLAKLYSSLFEVGSEGPPVALREGWVEGVESSVREEIVRFYDFFGYELAPESSWAPDHLAVELEFMHFLTFAEQQAEDRGVALSFQLAQLDFLERHPLKWLPRVLSGIRANCDDAYLGRLFETLGVFLQQDHSWQSRSLEREI